MSGDLAAVIHHGLIDELFVLVRPRVEDFLDHMIAIYLKCEINKFFEQVLGQKLLVLRLNQDVDNLLHRSCTM
jgi:hypothetical protein